MPLPSFRTAGIALVSITLACAQPETAESARERPQIPPGTMARLGAERQARAADSAARSAQLDNATTASAALSTGIEPAVEVDAAPLKADPAFGELGVVPTVYADSTVCPGEGCYKGLQWKVRSRAVQLSTRPDTTSSIATTLEPETEATALGWMSYTEPQPFRVNRPTSVVGRQGDRTVTADHVPGDTIWVLSYSGEGHFRVRLHNGALVDDYNLVFSAGGGSFGKRCESHPACWGVLAAELETVHWIHLRAPNGRDGWTKDLEAFVIPD